MGCYAMESLEFNADEIDIVAVVGKFLQPLLYFNPDLALSFLVVLCFTTKQTIHLTCFVRFLAQHLVNPMCFKLVFGI